MWPFSSQTSVNTCWTPHRVPALTSSWPLHISASGTPRCHPLNTEIQLLALLHTLKSYRDVVRRESTALRTAKL